MHLNTYPFGIFSAIEHACPRQIGLTFSQPIPIILTATETSVQHGLHAGPYRPREALFISGCFILSAPKQILHFC